MTSATLAVGRADLAYFRERIGATEAEPLQLGSPFDFQKQMKIFVVQKMPDPNQALRPGLHASVAEVPGGDCLIPIFKISAESKCV